MRTSRLVPFFHWHHFRYRLHPQELRAVQNDAVRQLPGTSETPYPWTSLCCVKARKGKARRKAKKRARETMAKARKAKTTPKRLSTSQGSGLLCKAWDPHAEGLLVEREKQEREGRRICGVNRPLEPADALIPGTTQVFLQVAHRYLHLQLAIFNCKSCQQMYYPLCRSCHSPQHVCLDIRIMLPHFARQFQSHSW